VFVARIDLPALCKITISLFNQIFFEIPQFCRFIPDLDELKAPTWVSVTLSAKFVSVHFLQSPPGSDKPSNWKCSLETSCTRLDWQLSFATQISSQLTPLLSTVRELSIFGFSGTPTGEEDVDSTQWLELFQLFTHVKFVDVFETQFIPGIVEALVAGDMAAGVFPELSWLRLRGYLKFPSVASAAEEFVATRRLSGRKTNWWN
jgi:hypothetical protein